MMVSATGTNAIRSMTAVPSYSTICKAITSILRLDRLPVVGWAVKYTIKSPAPVVGWRDMSSPTAVLNSSSALLRAAAYVSDLR